MERCGLEGNVLELFLLCSIWAYLGCHRVFLSCQLLSGLLADWLRCPHAVPATPVCVCGLLVSRLHVIPYSPACGPLSPREHTQYFSSTAVPAALNSLKASCKDRQNMVAMVASQKSIFCSGTKVTVQRACHNSFIEWAKGDSPHATWPGMGQTMIDI